ncbi:MAG: MotA/TolQ/ExbB proton channel family protein [Longimicrobiales bacterium]
MPAFFAQMGIWAYPMLLTALLLFLQIGRVAARRSQGSRGGSDLGLHSILVLGVLNAVMGFLGTATGISLAASAIASASSISPPIVWEGMKVALSTTIFGLLLLALALVAWLVLRMLEARISTGSG